LALWRADGPVVSLVEGSTFFPKNTASSSAGLRFDCPDVWGSAAGLGKLFGVCGGPSMSGVKEESSALFPLKTKAAWFAGS